MRISRAFSGPVFAAVLAVAGCTGSAEPQYYILPTPVPSESVSFVGASVALRALDLPLYARSPQVPYVDRSGAITLADEHRWADEPERAATRALAAALRKALDVPVLVEPWSRSATPSQRIDVSVDRFIGEIGGALELNGEFRIIDLSNRRVRRTETFAISVPVGSDSFRSLTEAHSQALARLSDQIVAAIVPGA